MLTMKKKSGFYEETLEVFEFQNTFVKSFSKNNRKNSHVVQALNVIYSTYSAAGKYFKVRKGVQDFLIE